MWIIALLLIVFAATGSAVVLTSPQDDVTLDVFGLESLDVPPAAVFGTGLGVALLVWLAATLLRTSITRATANRRDRRDHEEELDRLEQERAALAEENIRLQTDLERERERTMAPPVGSEPELTGYVDVPPDGHPHAMGR